MRLKKTQQKIKGRKLRRLMSPRMPRCGGVSPEWRGGRAIWDGYMTFR